MGKFGIIPLLHYSFDARTMWDSGSLQTWNMGFFEVWYPHFSGFVPSSVKWRVYVILSSNIALRVTLFNKIWELKVVYSNPWPNET